MIKLNSIKLNDGSHGLPKNPRFIKDDRFKSLCESIKTNPEYMPARPIVVDENNIILGGNMRWRACKELGMSEIPASWIKQVDGWSIEKKRRFILLDNRSWGDDDWDLLANEWDVDELIGSGFSDKELEDIIANTFKPGVIDNSGMTNTRSGRILRTGESGNMIVSVGTLVESISRDVVESLMEAISKRWGDDEPISSFARWANENLS